VLNDRECWAKPDNAACLRHPMSDESSTAAHSPRVFMSFAVLPSCAHGINRTFPMSVRALRRLQELTPHFSSRTSAAFSPDAELLAEEFYNLHPDSLPDKQSSQRLRE